MKQVKREEAVVRQMGKLRGVATGQVSQDRIVQAQEAESNEGLWGCKMGRDRCGSA